MTTTPASTAPPPGRRTLFFLLAVAGLLVVLLAVEAGWGRFRQAPMRALTADAKWIWAPGAASRTEPVAFYAVRDFSLDDADRELELLLAVDEEYLVWINGVLLGAGALQGDGRLDRWSVPTATLREGANRVAVEARSRRGAGGLLAAARHDGRTIFVSGDEGWRVFAAHRPGIVAGWTPLDLGLVPKSWQFPPTGRWRATESPRERAAATTTPSADAARWAESLDRVETRLLGAGAMGEDVWEPATLIDFGTSVSGQLELWLDVDPRIAYRFDVSIETPPLGDVEEAFLEHRIQLPGTAVVVPMGQRSWWRDVSVRQLRWVRVRGAVVLAARVTPAAGAEPASAVVPAGLLGIERQPQPSPGG